MATGGLKFDRISDPRTVAPRQIRLMIVDDSIVVRSIFARVLDAHPEFSVVASAATADQALERLNTVSVDIILLDLEMPGTDGLTALPLLLERSRGARVLIVSAAAADGADATVRALTLGAVDTLPKPVAGAFGARFAARLIEKLLRIGRSSEVDHADEIRTSAVPPGDIAARRRPVAGPLGCIAIGASTGGVNALAELFRALPRQCQAPILITQHLPVVFMPFFAAQLTIIAGRPAMIAVDGARLRPGELLLAPGDAHIGLYRGPDFVRIQLDRAPSPSGCLPSVDPMFEAVAGCFGPAAIGVVLSGMGRDGVIGAERLVKAGGEILAQDISTSVVWGMPGAVTKAGFASTVASPHDIALRLGQRSLAAKMMDIR